MTRTTAVLVLATTLSILTQGCAHPTHVEVPDSPQSFPPTTDFDVPDGPIESLTSIGAHCFGTGTDAVAARLRAADAQNRENTEKQDPYDAEEQKMPYGYPITVSDVQRQDDGSTCYYVDDARLK